MSKIRTFAPFSEGEPPVIGLSLACRGNKPCKQGGTEKGKRLPGFRFIVRRPGNRMEHSHKQPKSIIKKRIKK